VNLYQLAFYRLSPFEAKFNSFVKGNSVAISSGLNFSRSYFPFELNLNEVKKSND
jgi:hypothetical protein